MTDGKEDVDKKILEVRIETLEKKIDYVEKGFNTEVRSIRHNISTYVKCISIGLPLLLGIGTYFSQRYVVKEAETKAEIKAEERIKELSSIDWYSKGAGEFLDKKYEKAIYSFTKAIEIDPKNPYSYNYRGVAYRQRGEDEKALQDFDESTKLKPNNPRPYHNRTLIYFDRNDYKRAFEEYKEAIKYYNIDGEYLTALAFSNEVYRLFEKVNDVEDIKIFVNQKTEEFANRMYKRMKGEETKK